MSFYVCDPKILFVLRIGLIRALNESKWLSAQKFAEYFKSLHDPNTVIRSMKAENYQMYMEAEAGFQSNMGTADYFHSPFLKYALYQSR